MPRLHVHPPPPPHTHTYSRASAGSENEIFQAAISAANSITEGTCTKSCDFPDGEIGKRLRAEDSEYQDMAAAGQQVQAQKKNQ